ncbi:unnamed protein product, partial [marine sediment metagenome]
TAEFADISLGDAWLPEVAEADKIGSSVLLARTEIGESFLKKARSEGKIEIHRIDKSKIIQSQLQPLFFKKRNLKARINLSKLFCRNISLDPGPLLPPTIWDYFIAPLPYINVYISFNRFLSYFLKYIPLRAINFYRKKFNKLLLFHARKYIGEEAGDV